ncbi:MAG: dTDP-glucose 4,6-dehydratase [Deltaproteobacteria bacterium]|nr:dTDP-glucose 4,6-dehydratase [Deltaproteobacteria bacterium]
MDTIIVTGGAGFIGANFVRLALRGTTARVVVVDKLTYAGHFESLEAVSVDPRFVFVRADIADGTAMDDLYRAHRPTWVVNLAAESHVDRSIDGPGAFVQTNTVGTFQLLETTRRFLAEVDAAHRSRFRFLHVSTDEVYGSLGATGLFSEDSAYAPNSPYAASKAAADHLGKALPIYGDGGNIRDWLFVEDHGEAILLVLRRGTVGERYNVGAHNERTNLEVVDQLCAVLDELSPARDNPPLAARRIERYASLKTFVADRPGHDRRYAIDAQKIRRELGWTPTHDFASGLRQTVQWYLDNREWCGAVQAGRYARQRLGLSVQPGKS